MSLSAQNEFINNASLSIDLGHYELKSTFGAICCNHCVAGRTPNIEDYSLCNAFVLEINGTVELCHLGFAEPMWIINNVNSGNAKINVDFRFDLPLP